MSTTGSYFNVSSYPSGALLRAQLTHPHPQSYLTRALANLAAADEEAAAASSAPPARPISSNSSTPTRPVSGGAPRSPRAGGSRMSLGGAGGPPTPAQSDRLSQLQGLFGYTEKPAAPGA